MARGPELTSSITNHHSFSQITLLLNSVQRTFIMAAHTRSQGEKRKREEGSSDEESRATKRVSIQPSSETHALPLTSHQQPTTKRATESPPEAATKRTTRSQALGKPPRTRALPTPHPRYGNLTIALPPRPLQARLQRPSSPETVTSEWSSVSSDGPRHDFEDEEVIKKFQELGAKYQAWIDNPAQSGCHVKKATLTYDYMFSLPETPDDLVLGDTTSYKWIQTKDELLEPLETVLNDIPSVGLPTDKVWNYTILRQLGWSPKLELFKWSEYVHWAVEGAIIAAAIMRHHGPNWSEVALAHYTHVCPDINTLKYVYVADIVNKETAPFVKKQLYGNKRVTKKKEPAEKYWNYGTEEYQTILGTAIGKGVACLVLGAWPRGTHRITQIRTWFFDSFLELRFDIGEISGDAPTDRQEQELGEPGNEDEMELGE